MVPKTRKPYGIGPVGALEGLGHEFGAQVRGGGPAEDAAGVQVHDGGQVEPVLARWDVGNVTDPNFIRAVVGGAGGWGLDGRRDLPGWCGE